MIALPQDQEKAFKDVVFDISSQAHGHLEKARCVFWLASTLSSIYLIVIIHHQEFAKINR